jgi:site-specific DNA-methyltransferase (adenine-specific)
MHSSSIPHNQIIHGDVIDVLPRIESHTAQIIIADPPYNIGKDFGSGTVQMGMNDYLDWCDAWISECMRILKPTGSMYIYGFSETLALILSRVPSNINRKWLIWHYTNKNVPSLNFWQRSHESILLLWKDSVVFHRDRVREAYTSGYVKNSAGKTRRGTKGRYGTTDTVYNAHPDGALPRDVIKVPALAGGAGKKERVDHPTQKPIELTEKLIHACIQEEGIVLVPFAGSGTECIVARQASIPFIGIELNGDYVELAQRRLADTVDHDALL